MKTTNSNRPASVWPSTKYRSSFPECFTSGETIRGWLKNICSHSDPVTPCPSQFFKRTPGSHSKPVHFDNRSSGSILICIHQIYTARQEVPDGHRPNVQAKLRGLMFSRRAAVSSSLWLDRINIISL